MLVLSRQKDEKIQIGENIFITVLNISGRRVRLGITAPDDIIIKRSELADLDGGRLNMADSRQSLDNPPASV